MNEYEIRPKCPACDGKGYMVGLLDPSRPFKQSYCPKCKGYARANWADVSAYEVEEEQPPCPEYKAKRSGAV